MTPPDLSTSEDLRPVEASPPDATRRPGRGALARLVGGAALALAGALVVAPLLVAPAAAPAHAAQIGTWEIRSFHADIEVVADGSLRVTESIEVDFHVPSHGIYREIPFRVPVGDGKARRYRFDEVRISAGPDTPSDLHTERSGDFLVWRIGREGTLITGPREYQISYRVRGALNRFDSHDELFWNVTGDRWEVPIERASATVRAPEITDVTCYAGPTGATDPCAEATRDGDTARFTADTLSPGSQLDVVVAIPPGMVDVPPPELEPTNPVLRVFQVDPVRGGASAAVLLVGLAGAVALGLRGRDAPPRGDHGQLPGGVEYRPPDGLRPAELRTLLTEKADEVSLSATLVDLAVRGHLRIEEKGRTGKGLFAKPDWVLHRLDAPDDGLRPYELEVLRGLFGKAGRPAPAGQPGSARARRVSWLTKSGPPSRRSVKVSTLGQGNFHQHYRAVIKELYRDVVRRGYYRRSPQAVRAIFTVLSLAVLALGIAGIVLMFERDWSYGLVVAPIPVVGLILLALSWFAPYRTPAGSSMYRRARGFREFIRTAEADRMAFAERERIFAEYLPYAMAFGCVHQWVAAFERIGMPASAATGSWYVGTGQWDFGRVTAAVSGLGTHVGGTMRQTSSSSGGSGFSGGAGGGGGGGGGGRW